MSKRSIQNPDSKPLKLLLWTAIAGLIFGLIGFGEIAEDYLRTMRNGLHQHKATGQVVVVTIDDAAMREVGNWPWSRTTYARLVDRLTEQGANRIFFDINFSYPSADVQDRTLAEALKRSGKVTLATRFKSGTQNGTALNAQPLPGFKKYSRLATISLRYNYQNAVWQIPYAVDQGGEKMPSMAAAIAERDGGTNRFFRVDYSTEFSSLPTISAGDVLSGRVKRSALAGKQVIIGTNSDIIGDKYFLPGYGRTGGVFIHAIAAETLLRGKQLDIGWIPGFFLALGAVAAAVLRQRFVERFAIMSSAAALLTFGPIFLEARLIFADVTAGLFVLLVIASVLGWRRYRTRGLVNPVTNLPNLNALRANRDGRKRALVAGRVLNCEEIVAALPPNSEPRLVEQIVSRLKVGSAERVLYQGDGGIFAWFEEPTQPVGNHLEALYALFRNPARVAGLSMDLTVAFGVEVGSSRSISNRLASALVAADEAAHDGLKWKYHDPETLENASWKLSMLSQLDEAIDRGEVWVAYQPKLDLATRRVIGAEALARWTHPEKGPIAASEFVAAAEQNNRIAKLTDFVLDKAVAAAAQIYKRGGEFNIAVNLSARLLNDKGFTLRLSAALARHGLPAQNLTLELTETAALAGNGDGLGMISRLRDLGVSISIDDYGTGLSTLEYLKKIPATEIKIDQSFVKGIVDNRSDRLMVQSTIGLAHSLGRKVVAEGVEHRDILDLLVEMGCDIAQGFAIGRPMSLDTLTKRLSSDRKRTAA